MLFNDMLSLLEPGLKKVGYTRTREDLLCGNEWKKPDEMGVTLVVNRQYVRTHVDHPDFYYTLNRGLRCC